MLRVAFEIIFWNEKECLRRKIEVKKIRTLKIPDELIPLPLHPAIFIFKRNIYFIRCPGGVDMIGRSAELVTV